MEREPLDWWLDRINLLIDMMGEVDLGGALDLDFSKASLGALEAAARERLADPAEALYDDEQPFTASVVAYLGETLMRVGGGRWDWVTEAPAGATVGDPLLRQRLAEHRWRIDSAGEPDAPGFPTIRPDPATGLEALSPTHLLLQALASGNGEMWTGTYRRWQQAVDAYAAGHPGWTPAKEHTLADAVIPAPPPSPVLDEWLARQQQHFPEWAARYRGNWDYSRESIDRLTALVTEVTPTVEAFQDPANADFVDGATYYLGETFRRAIPCRWVYRESLTGQDDITTAYFDIQLNDNADFTGPCSLLRQMIRHNDPGRTRAFFDQWTSP